jgi:RimJ/RimL family protein N-acetyltransferase
MSRLTWNIMGSELILREVQEGDLTTFFEQQLDPEAVRMAAVPSRTRAAFMLHWTKSMAVETSIFRTIIFHGEVAGHIVYWEESGEGKIGYWLGKGYWGKGIATAALSLFLGFLKVRPLYARLAKHNIASRRVLEKCGFTISGEDIFSETDGKTCEDFIMRLGLNPCNETPPQRPAAEPAAAPNGGPVMRSGNSRVSERPPSVS